MLDYEMNTIKNTLRETIRDALNSRLSPEQIKKYIDPDLVDEVVDAVEIERSIDKQKQDRENRTVFILKKEHLDLMKRFHIDWNDSEFGAPTIDSKRPYGNSDTERDIREITKQKLSDSQCMDLHEDTKLALEIFLRCGQVNIGTYERRSAYTHDWKLVGPV